MPKLSLAETKGACHLAYEAEAGQQYIFPGGAIWNVLNTDTSWGSGLKSILIQPESEDKDVTVLAFAGTDSVLDVITDIHQAGGFLPFQYHLALGLAISYQKQYGNLFLTGHSLGGGLAAYSSVKTRISTNTINPAPLVGAITFKSLGKNPQIVNYIAGDWEVVSSSPGINPGKAVHVAGSGNGIWRHMLENVAPELGLPRRIGGYNDIMEEMAGK